MLRLVMCLKAYIWMGVSPWDVVTARDLDSLLRALVVALLTIRQRQRQARMGEVERES